MEPPSRNIHVIWSCGSIQKSKLIKKLYGVIRLNSGLRSGQEELLDPFMPEAANHAARIVLRNATLYNGRWRFAEAPEFHRKLGPFTASRRSRHRNPVINMPVRKRTPVCKSGHPARPSGRISLSGPRFANRIYGNLPRTLVPQLLAPYQAASQEARYGVLRTYA